VQRPVVEQVVKKFGQLLKEFEKADSAKIAEYEPKYV